MDQPWNPWQALRQHNAVELWFADLGGCRGLWVRGAAGEEIYLDVALGRRERRAVLAHELIHAERGIGHGGASALTMAKEERLVWDEALRRLVPVAMTDLLSRRAEDGPALEEWEVADELDIPLDVVRRLRVNLASRPTHGTAGATDQ